MGIYYSLYEWYNPLWLPDKPRYVEEHMIPQFKDVVTRYKPAIIFSDGEWELPRPVAQPGTAGVAVQRVAGERRSGDRRPLGQGHAPQARRLLDHRIHAGMSGMDHPWEESRGMGFSYGYNRAERLEDYHTGRELVLMLVES